MSTNNVPKSKLCCEPESNISRLQSNHFKKRSRVSFHASTMHFIARASRPSPFRSNSRCEPESNISRLQSNHFKKRFSVSFHASTMHFIAQASFMHPRCISLREHRASRAPLSLCTYPSFLMFFEGFLAFLHFMDLHFACAILSKNCQKSGATLYR